MFKFTEFIVIALFVPKVKEALVAVEVSVFCGLSTPLTPAMGDKEQSAIMRLHLVLL